MTLFAELISNVREQNLRLGSCLLKAKDLAHRLKSQTFIEWVDAERMGYTDLAKVPDYRWVRLEPMVELINELFPGSPEMDESFRLEDDKLGRHRSSFERFPLVSRVEELEGFAGAFIPFETRPAVTEAVRDAMRRQWGKWGRIASGGCGAWCRGRSFCG